MNIWEFSGLVSRRLMQWNLVNLGAGALLMLIGGRFLRGVGTQFAGWAAVNLGIGWFGARANAERAARADAKSPLIREMQARSLRRLLWVNAGLDVLYMIGGLWYALRAKSPRGRGMGVGVIFQGLFLFIFDVLQAREVPER
jgi:hypothetical protein